jgi:glycosyltransferase involved in cell wall biosynthesis
LIPSFRRLARDWVGFCRELRGKQPRVLLAIDYLLNYEYVLWACPRVPLVLYIRDPRGREEWSRIAAVPGAARRDRFGLERIADQHADSLRRVLRYSRWLRRPVVFVTNGQFLVDRARREYGLPHLTAHDLPNPLPLPDLPGIAYGERPMLLVIGRLDPVKRPALALALAERFPHVEFYFAGEASFPELVRDLLERHRGRPNVTFGGLAVGELKDALFRRCWALLNTSVHEGLPVSFLEAFSYGKCVISSADPAGLVSRFGYRVEEPEGCAESESVALFEAAIRRALDGEAERRALGAAARRHIEREHAFEGFDRRLKEILTSEGIPWS